MPERNIFKTGLRIGTHHPRQTADLLAGHGIALVRHGRRSFLFFAEILFSFADFRPLKMTDFGRDLVEGAGDYCEGGQIVGVPVALDDLR